MKAKNRDRDKGGETEGRREDGGKEGGRRRERGIECERGIQKNMQQDIQREIQGLECGIIHRLLLFSAKVSVYAFECVRAKLCVRT